MKFISCCSGIEAASVAWTPLGWEAIAFAEIEPFPSRVLKFYYPNVPNLGDMTKFREWVGKVNLADADIAVMGTPCQGFSFAGLRGSLADPRGQRRPALQGPREQQGDSGRPVDRAPHCRAPGGQTVSHPAQAKYGACQATKKNGRPCGMAVVRGGCCMYHQPEERLRRALAALERNEKERQKIIAEIQAAHDAIPA